MENCYKKLYLNPKCLRPAHEVNDDSIYMSALNAINQALHHKYITESEINILESLKKEIRTNRFSKI